MDVKYYHEKILVIIALMLCAAVLFYNAFFIPQASIPTVIYVEKEADEEELAKQAKIEDNEKETDLENNQEKTKNDEEHISKDSPEQSESEPDSDQDSKQKVNINIATADELADKLTGIGDTIAKRIVDYRNSNGPFASVEDIKNVSGIGEKKFDKIKNDICV